MKDNLEKEFVTYEQALALQELGFDEPCLCFYNKHIIHHHIFMSNINDINDQPKNSELTEISITAPLKQQVFRWFRENHELYANLFSWLHEEELGTYHEYEIYGNPNGVYGDGKYDTYEEAENACIDKLILICKQQKNER